MSPTLYSWQIRQRDEEAARDFARAEFERQLRRRDNIYIAVWCFGVVIFAATMVKIVMVLS